MSFDRPKTSRRIPPRLVSLVGLVLLMGCFAIPLRHDPRAPALGSKVVVEKKEPNILVAADRTWCETSKKKFESARVGEAAWCVWKQ